MKENYNSIFNYWKDAITYVFSQNFLPFLGIIINILGIYILYIFTQQFFSTLGIHLLYIREILMFIFYTITEIFIFNSVCYVIKSNTYDLFYYSGLWNFSKQHLLKLTVVTIIKNIFIVLGIFFYVIPGLLVATSFSLVQYFVQLEDSEILNAFKKSFYITKDFFLPLLVICTLLIYIPAFVLKGFLLNLIIIIKTVMLYKVYLNNNKDYTSPNLKVVN